MVNQEEPDVRADAEIAERLGLTPLPAPVVPPVIDRFVGEWRWLSNFGPVELALADGLRYPTLEHAYQAQKTTDLEVRRWLAGARTPGEAKIAGRRLELRPDWDDLKLDVMRGLLRVKFAAPGAPGEAGRDARRNRSEHQPEPTAAQLDLGRRLVATGSARLVEGNDWGDRFWGVCHGIGENWLGRLLVQRRWELREAWGVRG